MNEINNIKAFTTWNNEQIYSGSFFVRLLILNFLFSGGIYILASVAKVNAELSTLKWICVVLCMFLILMTFYLLIHFKRKRAGKSLFYGITMVNLSIAIGGMGLYAGFFLNHHTLDNYILAFFVILYLLMFFFSFLLNRISVLNGAYVSMKMPNSLVVWGVLAVTGILAATVRYGNFGESTKAIIAITGSIVASFIILLAAANCFLRWYYILRYKG